MPLDFDVSQRQYELAWSVSQAIQWPVLEIRQTRTYASWFAGLRDRDAKVRIDIRIRRLSLGNPGDVRPVGEGVSALRVDHGPGYRVYFTRGGNEYVLAGGSKASQDRDIRQAGALARELQES